ncbi:MAG: serine hydrolase [Cyclobacteriaceae bacterium]
MKMTSSFDFQILRILSFCLMVMFISCSSGDDDDDNNDVEPEPDVLELRVPRDFLTGVGSNLKLSAFQGTTDVSSKVTWATSNPAIATINEFGQITAVENGRFSVSAKIDDQTKSASLEVFPVAGDGTTSMDLAFISFLRKFQIPGGVYGVIRNEKLVALRAYGVSDQSAGTQMEPENLFRVASVSKPITGVATMKLIEEGKLNLNDKAFEILGDLIADVAVKDSQIFDITINQLLHHTAGWDRGQVSDPMFNQERILSGLGLNRPATATEVVQWLATQRLNFPPGSRYAYHNLTYLVLGRVIEAVTGQTYEEYVQQAVFEPAGALSPRTAKTKLEERFEDEVRYHYRNQSSPAIFDPTINALEPYGGMGAVEPMDSHGGWVLSIADLARFGVAVDGEPGVPDILSANSHAQMISDPGSGYGAGWFLNPGNHNHTGGMPGTAAVLWVDASRNFIIVGALNGTPIFGTQENSDFFSEYVSTFINIAISLNPRDDVDLFEKY